MAESGLMESEWFTNQSQGHSISLHSAVDYYANGGKSRGGNFKVLVPQSTANDQSVIGHLFKNICSVTWFQHYIIWQPIMEEGILLIRPRCRCQKHQCRFSGFAF